MSKSVFIVIAGFSLTPLVFFGFAQLCGRALGRDLAPWARHDAAQEITRSIFVAVDLYRRDHQRVPDQDQGLGILVPEYVNSIPSDPWGRPLLYRAQGGDWADVISLGADGAPGGVGTATDISARYGSPGTSSPRSLNHLLLVLLMAIPVCAFAASYLHPTGAPTLIGIALFWGFSLSATIAPDADLSLTLLVAFAAVSTAFTGVVLSLGNAPGGHVCALIGSVACLLTGAFMIGVIA